MCLGQWNHSPSRWDAGPRVPTNEEPGQAVDTVWWKRKLSLFERTHIGHFKERALQIWILHRTSSSPHGIHMYFYVYVYVYVYVYLYLFLSSCICLFVFVYLFVSICICLFVFTYIVRKNVCRIYVARCCCNSFANGVSQPSTFANFTPT